MHSEEEEDLVEDPSSEEQRLSRSLRVDVRNNIILSEISRELPLILGMFSSL